MVAMTKTILRPNRDELKNIWLFIACGEGAILEIRALWPKGISGKKPSKIKHFKTANYESVDQCKIAFEDAVLELNEEGYNIYTVMNPIREDFLCIGGAKDADIRYRDLLLIDIDRSGNTSAPANQTELDAANTLANEIRSYLTDREWPEPITVLSGNGYHLYYILNELPNNEIFDELVCRTLNNLATKFNNSIVSVDTTVYNASRITKVPGTIMRKGDESFDRPYRMAVVLS